MLHEAASLLPWYPHPLSWASNLLNQWVTSSSGRQNLGSKEFKNKIFGNKNLAAASRRNQAAFTTTYFQDSNSAPYFETGAVKILTPTKYLSG
jgi:hypothetical protein